MVDMLRRWCSPNFPLSMNPPDHLLYLAHHRITHLATMMIFRMYLQALRPLNPLGPHHAPLVAVICRQKVQPLTGQLDHRERGDIAVQLQ